MVVVWLEYTATYLTMDGFPGDPNRGWELPPAMVQCASNTIIYSSSMLVLLPVPNMSMPFNVLSLTCSLFAYLIGTVLIVLTKKGSEKILYKLHPEKKPSKSKLAKVKQR
jgi:hypothetical protein